MHEAPQAQGFLDLLGSSTSVPRFLVVTAAAMGIILFVAFVTARLVRSRVRGVSIRMQVFLALAATVGAFAFGLGLLVIDRIEARAVRIATQAAGDEARVVAAILGSEMDRSSASLRTVASQLQEGRFAAVSLEVFDERGQVLFPPGASRNGEPERGTVSVDEPVVVNGQRVGTVRVVKPTVVIANLLQDFAPTVLVISLALGAVAAIAAAWIGRAIAAPIEAISEFGERVSEGERTRVPPASSGREVMRLWRSIDSMRRQLEGRPFVETFAADLSHEIKNPVAAIRASAEVLEEGAIDDPEAARRFVARIREAALRIERLLRELLDLASIEARGVESFPAVDVARVTQAVAQTVEEPPGRIDLRLQGDLRVRGDEVWIGRAVRNLIDNALVHSPPDSRVTVHIGRAGDDVVVRVGNDGAVPEHVQRRLFGRFVTTRADKGGSGLGLSIVRAVAEAHGGTAELGLPGPPRVEFRLALPAYRRAGGEADAPHGKESA